MVHCNALDSPLHIWTVGWPWLLSENVHYFLYLAMWRIDDICGNTCDPLQKTNSCSTVFYFYFPISFSSKPIISLRRLIIKSYNVINVSVYILLKMFLFIFSDEMFVAIFLEDPLEQKVCLSCNISDIMQLQKVLCIECQQCLWSFTLSLCVNDILGNWQLLRYCGMAISREIILVLWLSGIVVLW